jgi:hypothetical protein
MAAIPIPITPLHASRLLFQVQTALTNMQADIPRNATAWAAMAQAQNPPFATVAGYIASAIASYQRILTQLQTLQADVSNGPRLTAELARVGLVASDLTGPANALQQGVTAMANFTINSYVDITTLCNAILAVISQPPSLWPE